MMNEFDNTGIKPMSAAATVSQSLLPEANLTPSNNDLLQHNRAGQAGTSQSGSYFYPTAFSCWDDEEHEAIDRVLVSEQFTMGQEVAAFEREFSDFHRMKHGIMVNSGSSANLIAVAALFNLPNKPLKRGMRAVVPALAWPTTYAPLVQHGLELILADCDETWNAKLITNTYGIDLVIGCSILGNPAKLVEWKDFADSRRAYFLEDNCESLGSVPPTTEFHSVVKRCGTFGLMNTFSFFYSHQISAIEGGMILTNDDECWKLCRMLRNHGWSRGVTVPKSFDDEYDFRLFGYNVRPLEMHGAIARCQLRKLDRFKLQRLANVGLFRRLTEGLPITHQSLVGEPDPFGLAFTVRDNEARQRLSIAFRKAGIDCRPPTGGSFRLHKYGANAARQKTPNADFIHRCGMFLGNGPLDLSEQISKAVEIMKETL
jgi:CDP-4-dehydro-6-deoxyglucose reductase, E1